MSDVQVSSPSVDTPTFRSIMASFASGICVVTTIDVDTRPRGFTCSAFCSVSADPPLLLVSVSNASATLTAVCATGHFAVNILGREGREVSQVFASPLEDKFARARWHRGPAAGMPLLADTVAHAECEVHAAMPAGDHTLIVGRVIGGVARADHYPLAYWRGGYAEVLR